MSANKKRNDNILRPSGYIEYYLASLSESKKSNLRQKRLSAILKEFHCPPKIFFYLDKLIKMLPCLLRSLITLYRVSQQHLWTFHEKFCFSKCFL